MDFFLLSVKELNATRKISQTWRWSLLVRITDLYGTEALPQRKRPWTPKGLSVHWGLGYPAQSFLFSPFVYWTQGVSVHFLQQGLGRWLSNCWLAGIRVDSRPLLPLRILTGTEQYLHVEKLCFRAVENKWLGATNCKEMETYRLLLGTRSHSSLNCGLCSPSLMLGSTVSLADGEVWLTLWEAPAVQSTSQLYFIAVFFCSHSTTPGINIHRN